MNYPKIIVTSLFAILFLGATIALGLHLDQFVDIFVFSISNLVQNPFYVIYLITAILFVFLVLFSEKTLARFMFSIGRIYILISLVGFVIFSPQTIGLFVSVMNLGLGVANIIAGKLLQEYRQLLLVERIISKRRETSCTVTTLIKNGGFNKNIKFQIEGMQAS